MTLSNGLEGKFSFPVFEYSFGPATRQGRKSIVDKKIRTYKEIDKTLLKSIPNPTREPYEIKIKIPEFTFLGVP